MTEGWIRRRVIVHGRVQGVFFRASTAREAERVGCFGWVRNQPEGTVEAVFESDPERVEAMLRYCRTGPPIARVDELEVVEEPPEGLSDFQVRR